MKLYIFALFLILGLSKGSEDEFIIGGNTAGIIPYQVSLRRNTTGHICSGAIIGDNWIISTARCVLRNIDHIRVGTNRLNRGGQAYAISKKIAHEDYRPARHLDDIGLIKTALPMVFSEFVKLVRLPTNRFPDNTTLRATGWGTTSNMSRELSRNLRSLVTRSITRELCSDLLGVQVPTSILCTYLGTGQGMCFGDFGNPLVSRNTLHGVVSNIRLPCTRFPDESTRVSRYRRWITKIMTNN